MTALCSLLLQVYEPISIYDDLSDTVSYEVANDPQHEHPYLLAPRQYAEQEIDCIACSASIGTVEVGIIDVPTNPDDQATGWMTARVHDLLGRRCRLSRYIDESVGWIVIADGPAGSPKMDASYAAYRFEIRDTRDTERKLTAFTNGGTQAIAPRGAIYGFGRYTDEDGDHWLLPPMLDAPIQGVFQLNALSGLGMQLGLVNLAQYFSGGGAPPDTPNPHAAIISALDSFLSTDMLKAPEIQRRIDVIWLDARYFRQLLIDKLSAVGATLDQLQALADAAGITIFNPNVFIAGLTQLDASLKQVPPPDDTPPAATCSSAALIVDDAGVTATQISEIQLNVWGARYADVLWRKVGDSVWHIARPTSPSSFRQPFVGFVDSVVAGVNDGENDDLVACLNYVTLFVSEDVPSSAPDDGDQVEIILRYRGPASDDYPYYVEGTLGDVLKQFYNGVFTIMRTDGIGGSLYDPAGQDENVGSFLTRIRYDGDLLDSLVTRVLLRQTEPIDDGRTWSETMLYGPSGWIPALDNEGRISPISRNRPAEISSDLTLTDATVVASPNWNQGTRTISEILYSYQRFFIPDPADNIEVEADGLAVRDIDIGFSSVESELRYGQQSQEYDATAFSAIGDKKGLSLPGILETTSELAQAANFDVLQRFQQGVQTITVAVRRSLVPQTLVRAGSWVPWQLGWFPNRDTGLRGSVTDGAQVVSIRDDDCVWRVMVLEESAFTGSVAGEPGVCTSLVKTGDELSSGVTSMLVVTSDVEHT